MPSDGSSKLLELPLIEQSFLAACEDNDIDRLAQVNTLLSRLGRDLEQASSSTNYISEDNATILSVFSHNVDVTSSLAQKVQIDIEKITTRFNQQLSLIPGPQDLAPVQTSSSVLSVVLKQWSLSHMSYLFPSKEELEELASQTSTSQNQITLWFRNARTRSGWSKIFAHPRINKDRERLKTLITEYDSIARHSSPDRFRPSLNGDVLLQMLDKVLRWFAPSKQAKLPKSDTFKPWIKEVLNIALTTLKDKTTSAIDSSRQLSPSLPSKKRARTKKFISSPSSLSQSSTPILDPSSIPSLLAESSRSSLSQPTTTDSSSSSIERVDLSRFSGSLYDEPLHSCDQSPCPVSSSSSHLLQTSLASFSLPRTCTLVHSVPSLSPAFKSPPENPPMPPFNSERAENLPNSSDHPNLQITFPSTHYQNKAPTAYGPDHSADLDQFEDAEE